MRQEFYTDLLFCQIIHQGRIFDGAQGMADAFGAQSRKASQMEAGPAISPA